MYTRSSCPTPLWKIKYSVTCKAEAVYTGVLNDSLFTSFQDGDVDCMMSAMSWPVAGQRLRFIVTSEWCAAGGMVSRYAASTGIETGVIPTSFKFTFLGRTRCSAS